MADPFGIDFRMLKCGNPLVQGSLWHSLQAKQRIPPKNVFQLGETGFACRGHIRKILEPFWCGDGQCAEVAAFLELILYG